MKKLLISSLKFLCLSAMKFFLLRFNNFTYFLYTSSVIISLEFVFLNFRLTFGEKLLFLSVQQSSNLCVSNVQLLTTCHNKSSLFSRQRVSPFVRTRTTTTDRQTSLLAGSDRHVLGVRYEAFPRVLWVIVIHILEEPLLGELWLGQGLCEGLDITIRFQCVFS